MSDSQPAGSRSTGGPSPSGLPRFATSTTILVVFGLLIFGPGQQRSPEVVIAASPVAVSTGTCALSQTNATPETAPPNATPGIPIAADGEVPAQITTLIATLAACWQDTNWATSLALVTDRYLQTNFGTTDRALVLTTLQGLTAAGLAASVDLDTVADIRTQGIGFASADVVWRQGRALRHDRWRFIATQGRWLLDEISFLDPASTGDAVGIEAVVDVDRLALSRQQIVDPGMIVIHVRNLTGEAITLSVFRSTGTAELRDRLAGLLPPAPDSPFAGEVHVPAYEEADLVMIDLAPDTYTVVAGPRQPGGALQIRDAFSALLGVADA
jgi:hypothetical protein